MLHRIRWQQTVLAFTVLAAVGVLSAANTGPITKLKLDPQAEVVPLFEGRDDGRFDVRMSALNAHQANVVIANKTDAPLTVALPKAAVGVHVLPQFNQANGFFQGPGGQQQGQQQQGQGQNGNMAAIGNTAQSTGGPMSGVLNTGPGQGQGQNANPFNFPSVPAEWVNKAELASFAGFATIPAGKSIQLQMRTVCLHYGRPEPIAKMTYRLTPVEEFTTDPVLAELLENYSPRTNEDAMQAAAWHVANGMSWDKLAQLPQSGLAATGARLFNRRDVSDAQSLVQHAEGTAKVRRETASVVGAR
ncbi:MAG TPA: hypothetical protein VM165_21640 [Planctomycetaceae bacterium]|nr:hypothetical protein [Planctomycetaceae bacterium]